MAIGSNFVQVQTPSGGYARIHFDNVSTCMRLELDPGSVIHKQIAHWSNESRRLLSEVKEVSTRLVLKTAGALSAPQTGLGTDLVVMSGQSDIAGNKTALIEAQDKTLPDLFKAIKKSNEEMTKWMTADTLPLMASVKQMEGTVDEIKDRIFNVSLYAGLVEDAVLCADGSPAGNCHRNVAVSATRHR